MSKTLGDQITQFVSPAEEAWKQFLATHPQALDSAPDCARDALACYKKLLLGGKHLRPFLLSLGNHFGPNPLPDSEVLLASGSVEVLHNAFLVHDDIVDNSDVRRNEPTVHREYAGRAKMSDMDPLRRGEYGKSMALNVGDLGQALAQDFLLTTNAAPKLQLAAVRLLNVHLENTVVGQLLDLKWTKLEDLTEEQVLQIHTYKTAYYSFVLPLAMGCVLAGGKAEVIALLEEYGKAVGIAFQIQDDTLGLFGDEKELGKSVTSDVKEGKKTLLMVKAYARASPTDREFMKSVHGNAAASETDIIRLRKIVQDCGALEASDTLASDYVAHAINVVDKLKRERSDSTVETLREMAKYVIRRTW